MGVTVAEDSAAIRTVEGTSVSTLWKNVVRFMLPFFVAQM